MSKKASIIIPTSNRSSLLGATLESIIKQTFKNWECLIIDDGSSDYTTELMEFYCEKDSRLSFYYRPKNLKKGANSCRNYGFKLSSGDFIQWFDSDDLMVPEFLEMKIKVLEENKADYVISKALNFQDPDPTDIISSNKYYYRFDEFEINNYNYIKQYINWLTYDFLGRREILKELKFNERLDSAQERNFFSKLTVKDHRVEIIDEFLTLRRIHPESKQSRLKENKKKKKAENLNFLYETWLDLRFIATSQVSSYLFNSAIKLTFEVPVGLQKILNLTLGLLEKKRLKAALYFFIFQMIKNLFGANLLKEKALEKLG